MREEKMMSEPTVYVVGPAKPVGDDAAAASVPGRGDQLHSLREWFGPVAKEVPADKLLMSFDKTREAIDAMLAKLEAREDKGFRLEEFEISLAISGEGTIGFVSAAAETSVVLKFKRG
jgi:hypothetical protein